MSHRFAAVTFLSVAAMSGCSTLQEPATHATIGTVGGVYVRVARDLYLERELVTADHDQQEWVNVTVASGDNNPTLVTARAAPGQHLEVGDRVRVALGEPAESNLIQTPNTVLAVVERAVDTRLVANHASNDSLLSELLARPVE